MITHDVDCRFDHTDETLDHMLSDARLIIRTYSKTLNKMDYTGTGHWHSWEEDDCRNNNECFGLNPLINLEKTLDYIKKEIEEARNHRIHDWNDNGICSFCGRDGNV